MILLSVKLLLGLWLTLTAVRQIWMPPAFRRLMRMDPFRLIPDWKLFTAHNRISRTDVELRWKEVRAVQWEVAFPYAPRPRFRCIFNPDMRIRKWILERTETLERMLLAGNCPGAAQSAANVAIRNYLSRHGGGDRQFALVAKPAGENASPEVFYASPSFDRAGK